MMPILFLWQGSGSTPAPVVAAELGVRIRRRKRQPFVLHPEEIARQQREDERYLAELEKPQQVPAKATSGDSLEPSGTTPDRAISTPAAHPILADVIARAASAQQVIARARASSAEALAKVKADERRRTALLLLALD